MLTAVQFIMFMIPLMCLFVFGLYSTIYFNLKIKTGKINSWNKKLIDTTITKQEFLLIAQKLCLYKGQNLIDIIQLDDILRIVIKENPNFLWWFGQFYCIDYTEKEKPSVMVYARGGSVKRINKVSFANTFNAFVKL